MINGHDLLAAFLFSFPHFEIPFLSGQPIEAIKLAASIALISSSKRVCDGDRVM
jgi:hypothetical protein